jgi:MSHA pilin protein MshD
MCARPGARQRGVTLIELVIFIVIISVAVVGIIGAMNLVTRHSADPLRRKQALMIAEALLEEVELAQFTYCEPSAANANSASSVAACGAGQGEAFGPEAGETRPFDNVNDYANAPRNMPFSDASGNLLNVNGDPIGLSGYSATLTINAQDLGGITGGTNADPNVLHITVVVTYDAGQSVTLDGYRTRYAPQVQ